MENDMLVMVFVLIALLLIFCFVGLSIVHFKTIKEKKLGKKKDS